MHLQLYLTVRNLVHNTEFLQKNYTELYKVLILILFIFKKLFLFKIKIEIFVQLINLQRFF